MGEALRLLRIFNGYKSAELAELLEISQSYVSELENNKKQPTMDAIDNLNKENAKRIVYITDNEAVNELKKSINSKNQEIKQLEGQVRDLRQKIQWYIDNCN